MIARARPDGDAPRYFGLYPAIVTNLVDPEDLGRIEVKFPWLGTEGDSEVRAWATLLSSYAEKDQGFFALPEVDTQVVVGFEAGLIRRPYLVGAAWNGVETMPEQPAKPNNLRLIKSRAKSKLIFDDTENAVKVTALTDNGHTVELDATTAAPKIKIVTAGGHTVELDDTPGAEKVIVKTTKGHTLLLDDVAGSVFALNGLSGSSALMDIAGNVTVDAKLNVNVNAAATVNVAAQAAINILAQAAVTIAAQAAVTVTAVGAVSLTAGGVVTLIAPAMAITAPLSVAGGGMVNGGLIVNGGMAVTGATVITGYIQLQGDVNVIGTLSVNGVGLPP